jgi:hypothetical protein
MRQTFINHLIEKHHIVVEKKPLTTGTNKEIGFYLLHLPWDVLIKEAEALKLKVPLKVQIQIQIQIQIIIKLTFFLFNFLL